MSEYTPSTKDVRADYSETYEGTSERRYAKFDRWLAEVVREASEKAWDESRRSYLRRQCDPYDMAAEKAAQNPYRKETQ